MAIVTLKHATITGKDATGTPITVTLAPGPADFSMDDLEAGLCEAIAVQSAGEFLEMVEGAKKAIGWSLTLLHDGKLTDASNGKPYDLAMKQGTFASGTTRDPGGVVWTVDVVLVLTREGVSSTVTLTNNRLRIGMGLALEGNTLTLTGTAYGTGVSGTLPVVVS